MELEDFMQDIQHAEVFKNGVHQLELHIFIGHQEFEPKQSKMNFRILSIKDRREMFFGEDGIFCTGYLWDRDNQNGFGGAEIEIPPMGKIKGPWTSRPSIYMLYGAPHYDEVIIHRNYPMHVGMKIDAIKSIMDKYCPDFELSTSNEGEFKWEIVQRSDSNIPVGQNLDLRFPVR